MASDNPDKKIKATAALDNSQKRSHQLEGNYKGVYNGKGETIDLKFCSIYAQRGKQNNKLCTAKH